MKLTGLIFSMTSVLLCAAAVAERPEGAAEVPAINALAPVDWPTLLLENKA